MTAVEPKADGNRSVSVEVQTIGGDYAVPQLAVLKERPTLIIRLPAFQNLLCLSFQPLHCSGPGFVAVTDAGNPGIGKLAVGRAVWIV